MIALGTENFNLKIATGFIVGSLQEIKDHASETESDLKKPQKTIAV